MTNAEAIKIINQYDCNFYWTDGEKIPTEDLIEAFELAVKALEEQEPRVLTLDELRSLNGTDHFVWLEDNGGYTLNGGYALYDCYAEVTAYRNNVELNTFGSEVEFEPDNEEYGKTWRCWSAKPSNEKREATPWME